MIASLGCVLNHGPKFEMNFFGMGMEEDDCLPYTYRSQSSSKTTWTHYLKVSRIVVILLFKTTIYNNNKVSRIVLHMSTFANQAKNN